MNNDIITPELMTLVVALKSKHGIVLAGDKRHIIPDRFYTYNDEATKVFKINDKVGIAIAGDADDATLVFRQLADLDLINKDVYGVAKEIERLTQEDVIKWHTGEYIALQKFDRLIYPNYAFIIAGYSGNGDQKIFTVNSAVPRLREQAIGFVKEGFTEIAEYILREEHNENLTIEQLRKLAIRVIQETSKISLAVSENTNVIKVKPPVLV